MSTSASLQSVDTWRKVLAYTYIQPLEEGRCVTPKIQVAEDAKKLVEETIRSYDSTMSFKPPPCKGDFDPCNGRWIICELSMVNFQSELLYVDRILDTTRPQPSPGLSTADLDMQTASHRHQQLALMDSIFLYTQLIPNANLDQGIAANEWAKQYAMLKNFHNLMDSWPGPKPDYWHRGAERDLTPYAAMDGAQWERLLAEYYVQSVYGVLRCPPSLPHQLCS
ncbi:hypothetical protein GYMLUDRAFT_59260 [Collybiopsis luxurians FD-317 M1]|uniref:Uncharacterized protein n=1 Tax=Collybiopsis luxurians FD-317 M1 TaxID=944289 RepID=A0A0D0BYH9_9AGAR|nr:hypothetical protein GYMLUDRAFT_59260 [Collybiopsis luxurians FD-317 M1]